MHEMSIVTTLVKETLRVAREHDGRRVDCVHVKVGALRAIEPETMQFCWGAATRDTAAADAELVIVEEPAAGRCRACDRVFEVGEAIFLCPICGEPSSETVRGMELILETMDLL